MTIFKYLGAIVLFIALHSQALATPSVSGTTGTLTHGSSVTVSGSSFGSKSPVAPVLWDSVDDSYATKTEGAVVPTGGSNPWNAPGGSGMGTPTFTNTNTRGKWTAKYTNSYDLGARKNAVLGGKEFTACTSGIMYMSYWHYPHTDYANPGASNKMYRLTDNGDWSGSVATIIQDPGSGNLVLYSVATEYVANVYIDYGTVGQWNRYEITINNAASPRPGVVVVEDNVTKATITPSASITAIDGVYTIGADWSNEQDAIIPVMDWGEIYIDNTRARVEICNANTKASSSHCEIQIPQTTWGDTGLEIKLNQGSFADSSSAYLYVVDAAGDANTSGYPITFGSSGAVSAILTGGTIRGGSIVHP
jgi:hypothetical protein